MKKTLGPILIMGLIAVIGVFHETPKKENKRLLQANLLAALELEDKIIASCGDITFDYGDLPVRAPLLEGMGAHTFPITTTMSDAQTYFNQGMNLIYGFNHTEAHRSFKQVADFVEDHPMAYWGQAYALSPNINDYVLDDQRKAAANEAVQMAVSLQANGNNLEQALITALAARFVSDENGSISVDGDAYRMAMKNVAAQFADNADVLTLYAAAIMNTMPWNYWEADMSPRPYTTDAKEALEQAIELNPKHPGAHHYYIHLTELPLPDQAAKSGDALLPLVPGAGHLVHMPSHAYIRVGRYKEAAEANMQAILADESYISQCYSQGIYPSGYYPHNIHFLWSAATQLGDKETAIAAAKKTAEKVPLGGLAENNAGQEFAAIPLQAYVRFGEWNEILTTPYPGDDIRHVKLYWHYSRGVAFTRKGLPEEAQEELDALKEITEDPSYDELYATLNHSGDVADIAYNMLAAEMAVAKGAYDAADQFFSKAVESEDLLTYTEPTSWPISTRQNYGAFLVDQERYEEAVVVYEEDLTVWRNVGWALIGLYNAHKGLGNQSKANETMKQFQEAWQYADIKIERSAL
ncbi:MAG: hypothetical protein AAGA85_23360 [Bacteroidota bacterium]